MKASISVWVRVATVAMLTMGAASLGHAAGIEDLKSSVLRDVDVDGKVVYVDFWASWCAPCKKSFPWMQAMHEEFADDGLVIVAVGLDENRTKAESFLKKVNPGFLVSFEGARKLAKAFDLQAMPTAILYDRDGRVRGRHEGFENRGREKLRAEIRAALAEKWTPTRP